MSVFEILKATPKNNCGECGHPTCMAFAAAVHTGSEEPRACPYIDLDALGVVQGPSDMEGQDPDTALVRQLREKVASIDITGRAEPLGGSLFEHAGEPAIGLNYLGRRVLVSAKGCFAEDGAELDPRDQILLYNYLFFGGGEGLSGRWTGLESFPNSISKSATLRRYTEEKIASHFDGKVEELRHEAERLGAEPVEPCHADLCLMVPVLPRVPIQLHFWDGDDEDGFPPKVKVLFDEDALSILDIESLIFAAERMAETLTGQV